MAVHLFTQDFADVSLGTRSAFDRAALLYDDATDRIEVFVRTYATGQAEENVQGTYWIDVFYSDGTEVVVSTGSMPDFDNAVQGSWQVLNHAAKNWIPKAAPTADSVVDAGNAIQLDAAKVPTRCRMRYADAGA